MIVFTAGPDPPQEARGEGASAEHAAHHLRRRRVPAALHRCARGLQPGRWLLEHAASAYRAEVWTGRRFPQGRYYFTLGDRYQYSTVGIDFDEVHERSVK